MAQLHYGTVTLWHNYTMEQLTHGTTTQWHNHGTVCAHSRSSRLLLPLPFPPSPRRWDGVTHLLALPGILMEILQERLPSWQGCCVHKLAVIYVLASSYENVPSGHT